MKKIETAFSFLVLIPALWFLPVGDATAQSNAMSFSNECSGNSAASCVITAVGVIEADTPEIFSALLQEGVDGNRVLLNSLGGNLNAGIALGRAFRDAGMETEVGRWQSDGGFGGEITTGAICESACAYAFLGGTRRRVPEGNRLGFHQFYIEESQVPSQVSGEILVRALDEAQRVSAGIVSFLIEMDIDARIFALGSQAGQATMMYPDPEMMLEYDLTTPEGFGPFFLEPFRNGIVAASRRRGPTRLYDEMTQLTALCRAGVPSLLVSANGDLSHIRGGTVTLDNGMSIQIAGERVTPRGTSAVELQLTGADAARLTDANSIEIYIGRGQADGGDVVGAFTLANMDRAMIAVAFRFCI